MASGFLVVQVTKMWSRCHNGTTINYRKCKVISIVKKEGMVINHKYIYICDDNELFNEICISKTAYFTNKLYRNG